jgi:hypothetical protein
MSLAATGRPPKCGRLFGTEKRARARAAGLGDQARVPQSMSGRVDVVGEQANLETLLARLAEPFARRYVRPKIP